MSWTFTCVAGPFAHSLGGIVDVGDGMVFSSIGDSRLLHLDYASGDVSELRRFTSRTSGLARGADGVLYGCQEASRRVVQFHQDGSATVTATTLAGRYHNHPSDAIVDSRGRVWFTDPHHEQTAFGPQIYPPLPYAAVMRLERGANHRWRLQRVSFDSREPRALALSSDERTLYVAEGGLKPDAIRELRAYPVLDDGGLGIPTTMQSFGADARGVHRGIEGLCLDAAGDVLACGGWQRSGPGPCVYVFSPTGRLLECHPLPDDGPMRCAFGGTDLDRLYVTTQSGRLWCARDAGRTGLRRRLGDAPAH